MNPEELGLSFFTEHGSTTSSGQPSAFAAPDQDEVIARIDAVEDDDLESTFFRDSIVDVENASTRSFDIGVRMLTVDTPLTAPVPATTEGIDATPAVEASPLELPVVGRLASDNQARVAFILGGPSAVA